MASADYVNQEIKGLKKSFDNGAKIIIETFMNLPVFDVQVTDEWSELFTSTESLSGVRELAEQETPDTLKLGDGYTVTLANKRFGGAIEVTSTDMNKFGDSTIKVQTYLTRQRDKLLKSAKNLFATSLHLFLNEAFDSGSDYLAPDAVELCGTHTWNSTGTTFSNAVTEALDETAVDNAMETGGAFVDAAGIPWVQNYNTIVVKKGSAAERQARKLFAFQISPVAVGDINIYEGEFKIISTPYITSTNKAYWFMFDLSEETSPLHAGITEMPTLKAPIKQNNENIRTNVEGFWDQGVTNMPYMILGSTGTT